MRKSTYLNSMMNGIHQKSVKIDDNNKFANEKLPMRGRSLHWMLRNQLLNLWNCQQANKDPLISNETMMEAI